MTKEEVLRKVNEIFRDAFDREDRDQFWNNVIRY